MCVLQYLPNEIKHYVHLKCGSSIDVDIIHIGAFHIFVYFSLTSCLSLLGFY